MNHLKNKVTLMGRLGNAPEVTTFDSGKKLVRFSLATNERYKDKNGEWQEEVQWHAVNIWGKMADRAENLDKGQEMLLEGKIAYQSYENAKGEKKYSTVIEVSDFLILHKAVAEVGQ
ncbi:MAG: single-stranded DNA-binding protein [Bacteroidetes bacterium]|nr:single-stranded DNA-binding protein [Bacteroidota bacterium]